MSLAGIALAVGAATDASVVLVESAHKHLEAYAHTQPADKGMDMGSMKMTSSKPASAGTNEAVVQAIDNAGKTVTIKHGQLKSKTVGMPPMTMTFPVENASWLSTVKTGDKVKVAVDNVEDQPTVTSLTVQK